MGDKQPVDSYSRATAKTSNASAIVLPTVAADVKATEVKGYIYGLLPSYDGEAKGNPYEHIEEFLSVVDSIPDMNDRERVLLKLFPRTLKDKAKQWLNMMPSQFKLYGVIFMKNFCINSFLLEKRRN